MSLWLLKTVAPCMTYIDNESCYPPPGPGPEVWPLYNKDLITCPRHYQQTTGAVSQFYFAPGAGPKGQDYLRAVVMLNATYWPGWEVKRLDFDPGSGLLVDHATVGIFGYSWTGPATLGSYQAIYACMNNSSLINEINRDTLVPIEGGWSVNPRTWEPSSAYRHAIVNRIDNRIAAASDWTLDCWKNTATVPQLTAQMRLPNLLSALAFESRNYCWAITQDGVILKADYQIPRWEMISKVNAPEVEALDYKIAFDTKRKQIVVFRVRPDAEDGACQHQLEFYYPMVQPKTLTQPVPVTSLRSGKRVDLVAHLIGEAGEGVTPYTVNGQLAVPADGRLVTPFAGTEMNGRVSFQYQAPDEAGSDTLQLQVEVEETI